MRISPPLTLLTLGFLASACDQLPNTPRTGEAAPCNPTSYAKLGVGEALFLSAQEAGCLHFPTQVGAEYVLSAVDAQRLLAAKKGPEPEQHGSTEIDSVSYEIQSIGSLPSGESSTVSPREHGTVHIPGHEGPALTTVQGAMRAEDLYQRATPWKKGERFTVPLIGKEGSATARVLRIYQQRFVFAAVEADMGKGVQEFLDDSHTAMLYFLQHGLKQMQDVWGGGYPITSDGSQQILILFQAWDPDKSAGNATTRWDANGKGAWSIIRLNLNVRGDYHSGYAAYDTETYRLSVLVHEFVHAWQMRYLYTHQSGSTRRLSYGTKWGMEGTAQLLAMDQVRQHLGIQPHANFPWARHIYGGKHLVYALEPMELKRGFTQGYHPAASFLRDLHARSVLQGAPAEEAMREVARGAVEGWYGIDASGVRRTGLTARMERLGNRTWRAQDALLTWAASQAADDLTQSPQFQNLAYHKAADHGSYYGWPAQTPEVILGTQASYTAQVPSGDPWFTRIRSHYRGGILRLNSEDETVRWLIVRTR